MNTIAAPDRSPATSSRSASALNLIGGAWVEGRGNTSRDIYNPADTAELLAPVREAAPEQVDEACAAAARASPGWRAPAPDRADAADAERSTRIIPYSQTPRCIPA